MQSQEIRRRFLDFFKNNRHEIVPSSSLMPDDPSVLLTTAGMQQFKKFYTGTAYPFKNSDSWGVASAQKCFRTSDIEEVGDESHLTFFEMLGNFSFGGYFKREAIHLAWEFLRELFGEEIKNQKSKIKNTNQISKIGITIFGGDDKLSADDESYKIWHEEIGIPEELIERRGREDNFWGPTGIEGPCGPTTEIYINGLEIWNIVFNEYYCKTRTSADSTLINAEKILEPLKVKGVDTGMGLERLAMMLQNKKNIFETDLFVPLIELLPSNVPERQKRIMADHLRAAAFLLADGVRPSNKDRGYILRRLMRRVFVYENINKLDQDLIKKILKEIIHQYRVFYAALTQASQSIFSELNLESETFKATLSRGLKELEKRETINSQTAFDLYQSFGLPYEIIKELGGNKAEDLTRESFDQEFQRHQEISRAGAEKKFGGHGMISGDLTASNEEELMIKTRLHTATHLLNAALRKVLGESVEQRGSDITPERIRFDFLFSRKLTPEEIEQTENLVNQAISNNYPVTIEEMDLDQAKNSGALFFFKGNYPTKVKVYTIGINSDVFSKELCGGPHLKSTGEIGHFKIIKEESSSAGIRRIRAIVE